MRRPAAFLCDEMLGRLARYLRAAGYDTTQASGGAPDREWIAAARREGRSFLTSDRGVAEHRAGEGVAIVLPRGSLDALAASLSSAAAVDWLHAPFTRCLVDNAPLVAAPASRWRELPVDVDGNGARCCPDCGRLYWAGSHYRRMRARLAAWRRRHPPPDPDVSGTR